MLGDQVTQEGRWDRWTVLWAALFYVVLAFAVSDALAYSSGAATRVSVVVLAATLGTWHGYWLHRLRSGGGQTTPYLLGAGILWAALLVADPGFLLLGLVIFAPLCLHDLRWGAAVSLAVGGGWIWLEWQERGSVPWGAVAGVSVFVLATLLSVGYVATIVRQSRERQRLIDQLHATQVELAEAERQAGMLDERQRLAHDIHDTLTQGFASIVMLLEAADASLQDHPARRHVARALESARENLAESRRLVWALRPPALETDSLPAALDGLVRRLADESDLRAESVVTGPARPLDLLHETALLRVAQEALTNARKHAQAREVTATLSYMGDVVVLDIQDDGIGMAASVGGEARPDGGLGLAAMRERMERLGGTLSVESVPGEGTTVVAQLEVREPQTAATASSDPS